MAVDTMAVDTEGDETLTDPTAVGETAAEGNSTRLGQPTSTSTSTRSGRRPKCAYCRRDHKKCVRASEDVKCERCEELGYTCFGGLDSAVASSSKRVLSRMKCTYCRTTKQKCLPTDRNPKEKCVRCREKNLPCSAPARPQRRGDTNPDMVVAPSANHMEMDTDRSFVGSQFVSPCPANQATPPETPRNWTEGDEVQLPQIINGSGNQALQIETEDVEDVTRQTLTTENAGDTSPPQNTSSIEVCEVCISLKISPGNFVVEDSQNHRKRPAAHEISYQPGLFPEKLKLGTVASIGAKSQECPFCRLIYKATHDQVWAHDRQRAEKLIAYASWQLDGRERLFDGCGKTSIKPRSRRIRLHWRRPCQAPCQNELKLEDAYIVLVADSRWSREDQFLGRPISLDKDIISLTRDWVNQCQRRHLHRNDVTPVEDFALVISKRKFKLLDVELMQTVFPEQAYPQYIALSYAAQETFCGYIDSWQQAQGDTSVDEERLPRTLQDAIKLVRELGFRYLWVHPICTIYDEKKGQEGRKYPRDRNHHIMDQIFGNSFLTICAADEPDDGLVALRSPRKSVVQHIETCAPDLQLIVSHPAETYLKKSKWFTRAWTFQERFLAKRCLIFAAGRVWFQCRDAVISEDIFEDLRVPCWSVDMLGTPSQTLGDFQDRLHAIRAYMKCVEAYTRRKLTSSDDILVAFEGFSKIIATSLDTDLLHGLPSSFLDLALLWEFKGTGRKEFDERPGKRRETSAIRKFPSWSWCGWESSIVYRNSTLLGVQSNIRAWLSTHTWISWYVRDRYNMLRLLHRCGEEPLKPTNRPDQRKCDPTVERGFDAWGEPDSRGRIPKQTIRWPSLNRSSFFKSIPNLQPDVMDIDNDIADDTNDRDTEHLQFWSWSAFFRLTSRSLSNKSDLGSGLDRYSILDYKGDFCGTITLPEKWYNKQSAHSLFEFIAISDAKDFSPEEFDGWTYYIPKEKDDREWDLWYVLLVEKVDDVIVRRVALGKVFQEGFENSYAPGKEWREFIMT